jgi:hypothetical protein
MLPLALLLLLLLLLLMLYAYQRAALCSAAALQLSNELEQQLCRT